MSEALLAFILGTLYNVGKAGAHATRGIGHQADPQMSWARTPLIEGLPISDLYHAFSGTQWLFVGYYVSAAYGCDWMWYALSAVVWGTVWPLSKRLKGLSFREGIMESWYVQIYTCIATRVG